MNNEAVKEGAPGTAGGDRRTPRWQTPLGDRPWWYFPPRRRSGWGGKTMNRSGLAGELGPDPSRDCPAHCFTRGGGPLDGKLFPREDPHPIGPRRGQAKPDADRGAADPGRRSSSILPYPPGGPIGPPRWRWRWGGWMAQGDRGRPSRPDGERHGEGHRSLPGPVRGTGTPANLPGTGAPARVGDVKNLLGCILAFSAPTRGGGERGGPPSSARRGQKTLNLEGFVARLVTGPPREAAAPPTV